MKKLISLLLVLSMLVSTVLLIACSDDTDGPSTGDNPSGDTPGTTPGTTPDDENEPTEARIPLNVPDRDYGGAEVHILQWTVGNETETGTGWIPWEEGDVEEGSDMMSNAVFARNAWVEEQIGVTITAEYVEITNNVYQSKLQQDFTTSNNEYQLATIRARSLWPIIEAGLYSDMNEFAGEILHTDQPWWPEDAVASYTLGDGLYACATEMLLRDKGATKAVFFNTKLANDHGLTYLYELVEDGDWTLEMMIDACQIVSTSLDGDGLINSAEDIWGLESQRKPYMFFAGGGYKFAHVDDDGYIAYDFGSKETILAVQRVYEDVIYADWNYTGDNPVDNAPERGLFTVDKSLFSGTQIKSGLTTYSYMETEYGVLPTPKLEDGQDNYYSWVSCHGDSTIGIPSGAQDREMAAMALELMSYEGYYTVKPLLYETMLLNRLAKSEESKRSIEIIFDSRIYDPGQYWDSEVKLHGELFHLSKTGNSNIASIWASWESTTMDQIKLVNDFIDETR